MNKKLSRRDFLRILKSLFLSVFAINTGMAFYELFSEPGWVEVKTLKIPLENLAKVFSGLRIVQISDLHMGGWMDRERLIHVLNMVKEQKPDLIVITGDFVFGHAWSDNLDIIAKDFVQELSQITTEYPVFGVMGNHDHWTDVEKVRIMLQESGVVELRNDFRTLERDGEILHIAGVDDVSLNKQRLVVLYAVLPKTGPAILLAHEPDYADETSKSGRFGLQLSGHSHGGQVVFPFIGPLVLPYLGRKYHTGLYKVREMWQYTNRGVGMTSPFVRFNCRPEITVIELQPA
ncbi:MAG: metallophosphoesterase [Anaerolineales bacterium]